MGACSSVNKYGLIREWTDPYTMPMKKFQHIRVTAFREPLRTYERDTNGIEEHPVES